MRIFACFTITHYKVKSFMPQIIASYIPSIMFKIKLLTFTFFYFIIFSASASHPVINEVMASNRTVIHDEDGDYEDWIELYNPSEIPVNMEGFGLSDDYDNPFRWIFPAVEIPAQGYLLVWASGKDRRDSSANLHTNFSISSQGEEVLFTRPDGERLDEVEPTYIPTDISYGRKAEEMESWGFFTEPTPGQANTTFAWQGITEPPVFSHPGGFYQEAFSLEVTSNNEGAQIFYTRDGSLPDENSYEYTVPIVIDNLEGTPNDISLIPTNNNNDPGPPYYEGWQPPAGEVTKANVIRAIVIQEGYLTGEAVTQSYLVDEKAEERYSLPVFFLNTDRENFFDEEVGIYIPGNYNNMFQRGREWERPAHLAFFESDGSQAFAMDMGVRIHGGTTRSRPRKSLRMYARADYGNSWLNYPLFPEKELSQYKRFILRNSGNDWDQAVFRDGFMQYLARDLNVETQYFRPAILFLNGEYWGIHNIRDRYDQHYIYSHYGLEEHEMTVMENNSRHAYGSTEGVAHYNSMRSYINHNNISVSSNYAYVKTMMDPASFIDAQVTNIFIMNTDWPGNNTNYWRRLVPYQEGAPAGMDGRWRWHILDTDFGFGLDFFYVPGVNQGPAHNTLAMATQAGSNSWPNYDWSTFLLRRLLTNEEFRHQFINRFADLLNTTFSADNVVAVIDSIENRLQPEMEEHIRRWRRPVSMQEWHDNVQRMRSFGQQRPAYVRQHIRNQFNLSGTYQLLLEVNNPEMGSIMLNTIHPEVSDGWTGIYFRGIPITLKAEARHGYRFSHWSGTQSSNDAHWEVTFNNNANLIAHFEVNPDFAGDELNPPAHILKQGPYHFNYWNENSAAESFPPNMLFLQANQSDPGLHDPMTHRYHIPLEEYHSDDEALMGFPYKLTRRTRINGLGQDGISFINTGRDRDLGAAILALDTRGLDDVLVSWTGGTLQANARVYAIRMQYKIGPEGTFVDLLDDEGQVVEYTRSAEDGHQQHFGPIQLPTQAANQEYLQLRWKYYFTGEQLEADHGRRDMLRLDNIEVTATGLNTTTSNTRQGAELLQNYPNPATQSTSISFVLPVAARVDLSLFDMYGRPVRSLAGETFSPGIHTLHISLEGLQPGFYFYRMQSGEFSQTRKMMIQ